MIDGRETIVVFDLVKIISVEKGPTIIRRCLVRIFIYKARLAKAHKEIGVCALDFLLHQSLQKIETPPTTYIAPALTARGTCGGRSLRAIKQTAPPCWLLLEMKKLTVFIGYRPTNRSRSHIETDIVLTLEITQVHAIPLSVVVQWRRLRLPVGSTLRVKIRLCHKCPLSSGRPVGDSLTCQKPSSEGFLYFDILSHIFRKATEIPLQIAAR